MGKMRRLWTILLCVGMIFSLIGCGSPKGTDGKDPGTMGEQKEESVGTIPAISGDVDIENMEVAQGNPGDISGSASIEFSGDGAKADTNAVVVSGNKVTITDEGTYVVSGTLNDGMLIVNADKSDKVEIILNGVKIVSSSSAAIYVCQVDKVTLNLAEGSVNVLMNGESYTAIDDSNIDSVVFARDDLVLKGNGTLAVKSPAGHGIVAKDDLKIKDGNYILRAANHGFSVNDNLEIAGGNFDVAAGKDGFHADNDEDTSLGNVNITGGSFAIAVADDGIHASGNVIIGDGTIHITESYEGIEGLRVDISGGEIHIVASDDGINAAGGADGSGMGGPWGGGQSGGWNKGEENRPSNDGSDGTNNRPSKGDGDKNHHGGGFGQQPPSDAGQGGRPNAPTDGSQITPPDMPGTPTDGSQMTPPDMPNAPTDGSQMTPPDMSGADGQPDQGFGMENEDAYIEISGGTIYVNAEGDGLDSNGTLTVSGGQVYVSGPVKAGNGAIDYEISGAITGGIVIAADAGGMSENFSSAEQGAILLNVGSQAAGSTVQVADEKGNVLAGCEMEKNFSTVMISCPGLKTGASYTVTAGDNTQTISLDSNIYGSGQGMGFGGGFHRR